jgi:hypothetical protein
VRYLSAFADVTSLLGSFSSTDPNSGFAGKPWLFSDNNAGVLKVMEGSSASAVVCGDYGGWDVPPPLGTLRFRRLRVDVWTDPLRDASSNVTETSSLTANRALGVFAAVQFRLQRTDPDAILWGDLCTVGCQLLTDVQFLPVTDGDWLLRGAAYYGVQFSGWSDASE